MPRKLYLYREHTAVGDEFIHRVGTVKHRAEHWAYQMRKSTGTKNFDVVECIDGQERTDI
jgi:hypothetical protein